MFFELIKTGGNDAARFLFDKMHKQIGWCQFFLYFCHRLTPQ
jgi:hypothetical protein